jgi:hypothetical protein
MTHRLPPAIAGLVALLGAAASLGCGGASDATPNQLGQGQTLTVESDAGLVKSVIRAEGDHYGQGRNAFLVQFKPTTAELTGASAFMPVHGHGTPSPPTISPSSDGYRISDFIFSMPGLWSVTLDISAGDQSDKVEFSLDVP